MTEQKQRRLAAILMLDVVGYSRLMADDEAGILNRFLDLRTTLLEPTITSHKGRIVKHTGDGALVEFVSVSEAMLCALEIQDNMAKRDGSSDTEEPLKLRIGINLGEIIADGDDIYGNGVNVASRVEALAAPGGIAVTATVREHLRNIATVNFEDAGLVDVKNIPQPIRVFHVKQVSEDPDGIAGTPGAPGALGKSPGLSLRRAFFGVVAAVGVIAAYVAWPGKAPPTLVEPDGNAALHAIDKPSVIVMPFENLSGDPEQAYFADGMTDNLITDLSRIGGLLVMARNTSFSFRDRGEKSDAGSVGAALGVSYVVEGSVQRAGDHIRINASLTNAKTGFQIWARRLDREFSDLFALQDETASGIIAALQVELTEEDRRRLSKQYTTSLAAYDLYLRAWEEIWRFNVVGRAESQKYLRDALALDPDFALAMGLLATSYTNRSGVLLYDNDTLLDRALELAQKARQIDPELPSVQASLGLVHMFRREFEAAEEAFSQAIALDPNNADAYAMQSWSRNYAGQPETALEGFKYALILNPRAPAPYLNALSEVHFNLGNLEEAIRYSTEAISRNPEALRNRIFLAAAYAELGRLEDANWEVEEALILQPELTLGDLKYLAPYRDPAAAERLGGALRAAGLPE